MFLFYPVALSLLTWPLSIVASNVCRPVTWANPPERRDVSATASSAPSATTAVMGVVPTLPSVARNASSVQPGDINCRFWSRTYDEPNYYSCKEMANNWAISVEEFFFLNPTLLPDCSNIEPNARYCVKGFVEPLRSTDGFCGPQHNNATCLGTEAQCCNAVTFTCGDTEEDCARGTCYEGACLGDTVFSTDGTCGKNYGDRLCAGKWGDCCSIRGKCGTGVDFCAQAVCQSGNCEGLGRSSTRSAVSSSTRVSSSSSSRVPGSSSSSRATSTSTTSTSSSRTTSTSISRTSTSPIPSATSRCSAGSGSGNFAGLCSYSCSYGFCPSPCTCTPGTPGTPPALTGDRGYALPGLDAALGPLCDFACSHGYCPSGACTKIATTPVQQPGTTCVQGSGSGGYAGLCSYACHYGYCPPGSCTCDLYGPGIAAPPVLNTPGKPAPGIDASYTGLCSYACNHGYCPSGVCVYGT